MTIILITGKANTISAQLAAIQRMGLVPSGPRIEPQDIDADAPGYTPGLSKAVQ